MAKMNQNRRKDGKFASNWMLAGKRAPVAMTEVPTQVPDRGLVASGTMTLLTHTPATQETSFAPLGNEETQRFALAVAAAIRMPSSPADRAALAAERARIEARFGMAIDWAA
jgi:hypothetical protein